MPRVTLDISAALAERIQQRADDADQTSSEWVRETIKARILGEEVRELQDRLQHEREDTLFADRQTGLEKDAQQVEDLRNQLEADL